MSSFVGNAISNVRLIPHSGREICAETAGTGLFLPPARENVLPVIFPFTARVSRQVSVRVVLKGVFFVPIENPLLNNMQRGGCFDTGYGKVGSDGVIATFV